MRTSIGTITHTQEFYMFNLTVKSDKVDCREKIEEFQEWLKNSEHKDDWECSNCPCEWEEWEADDFFGSKMQSTHYTKKEAEKEFRDIVKQWKKEMKK